MVTDWPKAIAEGWHPVATVAELGNKRPLAANLMGHKLAIFRSGERVAVLRDRCPHRAAPLSEGRIENGALACPYHGWRFNADGRCVEVPGSRTCPETSASALLAKVEAGLVWTSLAETPPPFPDLPDVMHNPSLDRFWWALEPSKAGLLDALENHLDPAHPHYLHPWLVRSPRKRRKVDVEVRSGPWGAEAIYTEERRNTALLPALLEGQRARSIGRLWPPTIGEVRLENKKGDFLSIAVAFSPVDAGLTRPFAHFASKKGIIPGFIKRAALKAFHWPILQQDRRMLAMQVDNRGDEDYTIGPLDVLARAIWAHANAKECRERKEHLEMEL